MAGAIETRQVIAVSFFQLSPEIILDFYCTYIEVNGGLADLHKQYWTVHSKTGAGYLDGELYSNFQKANFLKLILTLCVILIVLLASCKLNKKLVFFVIHKKT